MKGQVNFQLVSKVFGIPVKKICKDWIDNALQIIKPNFHKPYELTIRITTESEITKLNAKFRHKNQPTNVLTFNSDITENDNIYLGDIVICAVVAKNEALQQNKSLREHFAHLLIHGLLHLFNYDHIKLKDAKIMEQLEIKILKSLGFSNPYDRDE